MARPSTAAQVAPPSPAPESHHVGELKRAIPPAMLILFVVGDIYARVGAVAGEVGGAIWTSFLVGIGIAALTALSYGELASKYPGAGGAALFVHKAFQSPVLTFIIAFAVLASGIASASAVARAFGGRYLQEFVAVPPLPVAILFILVIALINFRGISESIRVNMFLTVVELSGLLLIIISGGGGAGERHRGPRPGVHVQGGRERPVRDPGRRGDRVLCLPGVRGRGERGRGGPGSCPDASGGPHRWPADIIVMGTHGRTGIDRMLLGSVTDRVIRLAPCPVLTVRSAEDE